MSTHPRNRQYSGAANEITVFHDISELPELNCHRVTYLTIGQFPTVIPGTVLLKTYISPTCSTFLFGASLVENNSTETPLRLRVAFFKSSKIFYKKPEKPVEILL